jgi:WD40 repeat protein
MRRWEVRGGFSLVRAVAVSPDGRRALSASFDGIIRLWEVNSGAELGRFKVHNPWVTDVAFSPSGEFAVSGGGDHVVRIWNLPK